jgi:RNA polymerase sigma factor for flagellar operon FliA
MVERTVDRYKSLAASQRRQSEADLVRSYAPLVKRIALHLSHRLPPTVELDDLLQAGTLGLLEAARKFNPSEGASFETFAGIRIRGAMIDEVRPMDWTPRSVHRKSREFSEAVRTLEHRLGRTPRDQEVMAELGLDAQRYHDALRDAAGTKLVSYEAICPPGEAHQATASDSASPERAAHRRAFKLALARAIKGLGQRDQQVLSMYYDDELNFREIGEVLSVSEARVCQLHAKAMLALRRSLQSWVDDNPADLAALREDDLA